MEFRCKSKSLSFGECIADMELPVVVNTDDIACDGFFPS